MITNMLFFELLEELGEGEVGSLVTEASHCVTLWAAVFLGFVGLYD